MTSFTNTVSSYASSVQRFGASYVDNIPKNSAKQVVKSFAVMFVVDTLLTANPIHGLVFGALSATATLLHAAVSPVFKAILNDPRELKFREEFIRGGIAIIGTGVVALLIGNPVVISLVFLNAIFYGIRLAIGDDSLFDVNKTNVMVFLPHFNIDII